MLEQLTGLANTAMQLPLQYGGMYNQAFNPYYNYMTSQGNNMSQLGGQGINAYTALQGQQAQLQQTAMPLQLQAQMFNAIAPALGGLLSQYIPGLPSIGSISMPGGGRDSGGGVAGLQQMMNTAYGQARGYDQQFSDQFNRNLGMLPKAPYMNNPTASAPPAVPAAGNAAGGATVPVPAGVIPWHGTPNSPPIAGFTPPSPHLVHQSTGRGAPGQNQFMMFYASDPSRLIPRPPSPQRDPADIARQQQEQRERWEAVNAPRPQSAPLGYVPPPQRVGTSKPPVWDPRTQMEKLNADVRKSFSSQAELGKWAANERARSR